MSGERLNVIALISGGKDSFYSLIHCVQHGHRVVALANLFPACGGSESFETLVLAPDQSTPHTHDDETSSSTQEKDLNSFMYQTVGHEIIPLYAQATGLPLYRQPILGRAVCHDRDYDYTSGEKHDSSAASFDQDETESMLQLLSTVKAHHPEANALCSGAILSTYQRTRVESVAARLGLVPLSYLWKYPVLPPPLQTPRDEAQLLRDMAAAGLEARIIKVASAGLDESHLWERVSSDKGVSRIKAALRKFGAAEGASLGEGGEFETVVVDGPATVFKKRIVISEDGRRVMPEGGGSTWLMLRGAHLEDKPKEEEARLIVREPGLMDAAFQEVLDSLQGSASPGGVDVGVDTCTLVPTSAAQAYINSDSLHWAIVADVTAMGASIQTETVNVVDRVKALLAANELEPSQITSVIILLRDMADFPKINEEYGKLFTKPNPPSRITISSGSLLPEGRNIVMYLTAHVASAEVARKGLHVQSRSYWAPANIGPYSQAIETAVTFDGEPTGLQSVLIAGQIPLIPASMALPGPSETLLQQQIVLSLQHLWRIGSEMKVQCWTSAVAYFSRSADAGLAQERAKLAGQAWRLAHGSPDDEDETENGAPDPWDLKYNPQYQTLGGADAMTSGARIPDWSVYTLRQQNTPASCIPPVFAAEIESLPRQSLVEWHAHAGLKNVEEGHVELITNHASVGRERWLAWNLIVKTAHSNVVYTTVACRWEGQSGVSSLSDLEQGAASAYNDALHKFQPAVAVVRQGSVSPYLGYADVTSISGLWQKEDESLNVSFALIPCHSLWTCTGERLAGVLLYKTILTSTA